MGGRCYNVSLLSLGRVLIEALMGLSMSFSEVLAVLKPVSYETSAVKN